MPPSDPAPQVTPTPAAQGGAPSAPAALWAAREGAEAPIRVKLLGLVAIPLGAFVLALGYQVYRDIEDSEREATEIGTRLAQVTAFETGAFLGNAERMLAELAARPLVRRMDPSHCDPILDLVRQLNPQLANVLTLDARGELVCSALARGADRPTRPDPRYFFDETVRTRSFTVGKPAQGFITGRWVSTLAYPVKNESGALVGVVGMAVDLANYTPLASRATLPPGTVIGIISEDGVIISRSEHAAKYVGTAPRSAAGIVATQQRRGTVRAAGIDGTERFAAFAPIERSDWIALATIPVANALAPARTAATARGAAALSLAVLVIALTLAAQRRIARPMQAIAAAAGAVARGDRQARAPVSGARELAQVAREFNRMLDLRARFETELLESERYRRELVEHSPIGLALCRMDGRLVEVNPAFAKIIGRTVAETLGLTYWDITPEKYAEEEKRQIELLETAGRYGPYEKEYLHRDGHPVPVRLWGQILEYGGERFIWSSVEDVTARARAEALLAAEKGTLEVIATGAPLGIILDAIARNVESLSRDTLASILLLDADRVHVRHGAAPSLPEAFVEAIDGQPIGPRSGSCGTAAYRNEQVIVADIATDPLWDDYRALALPHGLRACWSTPIRAVDGRVLGTFAMYYREPRSPAPEHQELIGRVTHLTAIAIERRQAEEALRRGEEKLEALLESITDGFVALDRTWHYTYVNQRAAQMFGRCREDLVGRHIWTEFPESEGQPFHLAYRRVMEHGVAEHLEQHHAPWDRWFENDIYPSPEGITIVFRETTERVRSRQALEDAHERLQALTGRLMRLQEDERAALARKLHDGIGQNLAAIKLAVELMEMTAHRESSAASLAARLPPMLANGYRLIDETIALVRGVMAELRPPVLDDYGLAAALRWHAQRFGDATGIPVQVIGEDSCSRPGTAAEDALFNIAREAMHNAAKHARCTGITVTLDHSEGALVLMVSDDGAGFETGDTKSGAWGLTTMRERAEAVGAALEIRSAPGQGTAVCVRLPRTTA